MTPRRLDRITMSRTDDRITKTNCSRSAREALLWRRVRVASVGASVAGITLLGSLMLSSQQVASASTPVTLTAVVPVAFGSDDPPAPTPSMPADMPGMDMSGSSPAPTEAPMPQDMPGMDMGGSTPATTETPMPQDMPGMDMGGSSPEPTIPDNMSPDMPGMDMGGHTHGAAAHRPLAPVLGTFGGGTAAVLLSAGMLRRKDQAADLVKKAARISGRGRK